MNFAITGANGFLGVHIIHHLLQEGHEVRAIIRPGASLSEYDLVKEHYTLSEETYQRLTWHECLLYDTEGLHEIFTGADYVMHLAGKISYLKRDLLDLLEVNQSYTADVVNVAKDTGVRKILYCSSIAALSKSGLEQYVTEDTEWDDELPHSQYGYTKQLGELEIWRGIEEGLPAVVINPGIILGRGEWTKGSNTLFANAKKNFPFFSRGVTGWVGVSDVAKVATQLCVSNISSERYIVVSENKSFKEIADTMVSLMNSRKPFIEIKGLLYKLAYAAVSVKEILCLGGMLSKETVKGSVAVHRYDNTKLKKELGFDFEPMDDVLSNSV